MGLPACLIGRCCSCSVLGLYFVLVPLFSCYAFFLRLNTTTTTPPPTPAASATATALLLLLLLLLLLVLPLLLYSFLLPQVLNPTALQSSTGASNTAQGGGGSFEDRAL